MRLQAAARRRPAGDRFLGPGRLHGPAQRPPAHLGPRLRGSDRHRRRRGFGAADDRYVSESAAIGSGDPWPPRATRRWWSSIWSTSVGAAPWCARHISCSSWGCACNSWGSARSSGFACPLNQYLLADALGLTAIHVNRILRQLRERGLLTFREGSVAFHDLAGLRTLAEITAAISTRATGSGSEDRAGPPSWGALDLLIQVSAARQSVG